MWLLSRPRVTLTLDPDEVRVLVLERGHVTAWGRAPLDKGALQGDIIRDPAAVIQAVRTLWQVHRVPSRRVVVSIPASHTAVRLITVQPHDPVDEVTAHNLAARFWPLETSSVAWQLLEQAGRRVLFLLRVPREVVDHVYAVLTEAGLRVVGLEPKPLALLRAVGRERVVIVDVEPSLVTVLVTDGGIPLHVASHDLDAPLLRSRETKAVRAVEFSHAVLQRYNVSGPGAPVDETVPFFLTGSLGNDPFLRRLVREALGYPVTELLPPVPVPPELPLSRYAANIGLALKGRSR